MNEPLGRSKRRWLDKTKMDLTNMMRRWDVFISPRTRQIGGIFYHDNAPSGSINYGEFLD
jgi:hypothetical protein